MYAIHYADIDSNDILVYDEIPVTSVGRTVRDCIQVGAGPRTLLKAIDDAIDADLIDEASARQLRKEIEAS